MPRTSRQKEQAHTFINFLLEPTVAARLTTRLKYARSNNEVRPYLPKEISENEAIYPTMETIARLEWIQDVDDTIKVYDRAWTELKVK